MFTLQPPVDLQELTVVANFCEVYLAKEGHDGVVGINPQAILPAGAVKGYSADEALRYGLCQAKLESKQEVAERYNLPATTLREDPLQGRAPDAWLLKVQGTIDGRMAEPLRHLMEELRDRGPVREVARVLPLDRGGQVVERMDDPLRVVEVVVGLRERHRRAVRLGLLEEARVRVAEEVAPGLEEPDELHVPSDERLRRRRL